MQIQQKLYWRSWMKPLTDKQSQNLEIVEKEVMQLFKSDTSGHSYDHIKRVVDLTARLVVEGADLYTTMMIAYLHDILDEKLDFGYDNLEDVYLEFGLEMDETFKDIEHGVLSIGYKGGYTVMEKSLEAQIVSDADMLDAMGAIGIGRAFYYAGSKGQPFHDSGLEGVVSDDIESYRNRKRNVIAHFDEKLLKLKGLIVTPKAKIIAVGRHEFLRKLYEQYMDELSGDK